MFYTVPSRQYFTHTLLRQKSQDVSNTLMSQLQQAQAVSLTIDLWSNRQMKGFIGIAGHFVLDWTMHSEMLSCSRFRGHHTVENIAQQVEETLACFNIGEKITNMITDNASNMVKAFTLPGFEEPEDSSPGSDDPDSETEDCSKPQDITVDDIPSDAAEHDMCFAHTQQPVIKDGLRQAGPITKVLGKASNTVSHVCCSIHITRQ